MEHLRQKKRYFTKRIFTPRQFFSDLIYLTSRTGRVVKLFRDRREDEITDKILLVVSGVNNCKYCTWLDAKLAVYDGIHKEEVINILNQNFDMDVSDYELPALLYAQNFAESNRNPAPDLVQRLYDFYGSKKAEKIQLAVRVVTFGNAYFNTWLAALSRFRGKPAPGSSVLFEIPYFLCNAFKILPFVLWRRLDKNVMGRTN